MADEPKKTEKSTGGRPAYSDDQYETWLAEMKPHLLLGCSLNRAMEKSGLLTHEFSIRGKYGLNDWFSRKVDLYRATPGENGNEAVVRLVEQILTKVKQEKPLTSEEVKILTLFSEKHRTAQPFFVTRTETAESKREDLGKILDILESDYGEFGNEASATTPSAATEKQKVANDPPVQGEEQGGPTSNVQAQPHTA